MAVLTVTNLDNAGSGSLREAIAAAAAGDYIDFDPSLAGGVVQLDSVIQISGKHVIIDGSSLDVPLTVTTSGSFSSAYVLSNTLGTDATQWHNIIFRDCSPRGAVLSSDHNKLPVYINCVFSGCNGSVSMGCFRNVRLLNCSVSGCSYPISAAGNYGCEFTNTAFTGCDGITDNAIAFLNSDLTNVSFLRCDYKGGVAKNCNLKNVLIDTPYLNDYYADSGARRVIESSTLGGITGSVPITAVNTLYQSAGQTVRTDHCLKIIDPQDHFVDPQAGDFHLKIGSEAVGAGDNALAVRSGLAVDLDGNPRIVGKNVDLGCFEYQPQPLDPPEITAESDSLRTSVSIVYGLSSSVDLDYSQGEDPVLSLHGQTSFDLPRAEAVRARSVPYTDWELERFLASRWTQQVVPSVRLDAPQVRVSALSSRSIEVSGLTNDHADGFDLRYSSDPDSQVWTVLPDVEVVDGAAVVDFLTAGTTYYVQARAIGDATNYITSDWSAAVAAATPQRDSSPFYKWVCRTESSHTGRMRQNLELRAKVFDDRTGDLLPASRVAAASFAAYFVGCGGQLEPVPEFSGIPVPASAFAAQDSEGFNFLFIPDQREKRLLQRPGKYVLQVAVCPTVGNPFDIYSDVISAY